MAKPQPKSFMQRIWLTAVSLKLTLLLLFILSAACIIGTVVPQQSPPTDYIKLYGESGFEFIKAAHFHDLFGSWWFQTVMSVFALNLICCTINRLPRIWRMLFHGRRVLDPQYMQTLNCNKKFSMPSFSDADAQRLAGILAAKFTRPEIIRENGSVNLFAEKGRWSRLGFLLTHAALLLVMGGSLMGNLGFRGYMQLYEGEQSDIVHLRDGNGREQLDFSLRCDSFEVTFYEGGRPKDYKSSLTVIEDGKEVLTKLIEVNDPLVYRGIYFYQSSYGTDPRGGGTVELAITVEGQPQPIVRRAAVGTSFLLPGTEDQIFVDRFLADFALDEHNHPFSRSDQPRNPAVLLRGVRNGEELFNSWLFVNFPDFHKKKTGPYDFKVTNYAARKFTGLQVTDDPGVLIVWLGCALLLAGIYTAFFCTHRRVWVQVEEASGGYRATVGGSANKNVPAFKKDFDNLFKQLSS